LGAALAGLAASFFLAMTGTSELSSESDELATFCFFGAGFAAGASESELSSDDEALAAGFAFGLAAGTSLAFFPLSLELALLLF